MSECSSTDLMVYLVFEIELNTKSCNQFSQPWAYPNSFRSDLLPRHLVWLSEIGFSSKHSFWMIPSPWCYDKNSQPESNRCRLGAAHWNFLRQSFLPLLALNHYFRRCPLQLLLGPFHRSSGKNENDFLLVLRFYLCEIICNHLHCCRFFHLYCTFWNLVFSKYYPVWEKNILVLPPFLNSTQMSMYLFDL